LFQTDFSSSSSGPGAYAPDAPQSIRLTVQTYKQIFDMAFMMAT